MDLAIPLLLAALALPLSLSLRVVPEAHRFIVLRAGRMHSVLEPGLHCVVPVVDRVVRIDLDRTVPNWRSLPEPHLQAQLRQLPLNRQVSSSR